MKCFVQKLGVVIDDNNLPILPIFDKNIEIFATAEGFNANMSDSDKEKLTTFVKNLKDNGLWDKIHILYIPLFADNATKAYIDVKATYDTQTVVKTATFTDSEHLTTTLNLNGGVDIASDGTLVSAGRTFGDGNLAMFGLASSRCCATLYKSDTMSMAVNDYTLEINASSSKRLDYVSGRFIIAANNNTAFMETDTNLRTVTSVGTFDNVSLYLGTDGARKNCTGLKLFGVADGLTEAEAKVLFSTMSLLSNS